MEDAPDMFDVFWGDAQMMPEVFDSASSEGGPVGPAIVEADDDARLQTQSPLPAGVLPMGQQAGTVEQGTQAGSSMTQRPPGQGPGVAETIHVLNENVGMLSDMQGRIGSVASSSHRRSQHAVQLVERERAARALERQKFEEEIATLKSALKDQLEVS